MMTTRLVKLSEELRASGLDALALNPGPGLVYLTGLHFHLSERPVIMFFPAAGKPGIVLPELELQKLTGLEDAVMAFPYGEDPSLWQDVFVAAGRALGLQGNRIGAEPRSLRLLELHLLETITPMLQILDAGSLIGSLRLHKDAAEIEAIRRAIRIAQDALEAALPQVRVGLTEKELASELVLQLLRSGSEPELPFFPIVSSGPNSANPHAAPSSRKLQEGDLLVVDWGATVDGYISDLTRTFAVGHLEPEYQHIFHIVQEANAAGRAAGKPGLPCAVVDQAARAVIEKSGYGRYFTHRTGHGIGLEAHEEPYMRGDNAQVLEPGMVYTVEPGIYLPGRNGVRIEDNVVVRDVGTESLSNVSREWRQVG